MYINIISSVRIPRTSIYVWSYQAELKGADGYLIPLYVCISAHIVRIPDTSIYMSVLILIPLCVQAELKGADGLGFEQFGAVTGISEAPWTGTSDTYKKKYNIHY
jgi:hypothetical protein